MNPPHLGKYSAVHCTPRILLWAREIWQWVLPLGCSRCEAHSRRFSLHLMSYKKNGLVKILKKYDKRTGALIRLPFIQRVLQQPFFTTDLIYKLVKECEVMLDSLFPASEPSVSAGGNKSHEPMPPAENDGLLRVPKELAEIEYMESLYMKSTVAALRALKEIRSGSSTVSVFSLPPLQTNGLEEKWTKIPVLEQEAK